MRSLDVCMTCIHLGVESNDEYRWDIRYACEIVLEPHIEGSKFVKEPVYDSCPLRMEQLIATQEGT